MKYIKLLIIIFLFIYSSASYAIDDNKDDHFEGVWADYSGYSKIDDFIIIQKIEENYLVIVADVDDKAVNKGIGKRIDSDSMQYEMWGHIYTLDWFEDGDDEWLEKYIGYRKEEYPIYERVKSFSIDKF